MVNFSIEELTVIEASRYINDGEAVFAGTGLPLMATMLAQKTHAPHLCFVAETGPIAPIVLPTPLSVSDPRLQYKAVRLGSLREVLGCMLQRGMIDVGFVGGAEIDQFGNINTRSSAVIMSGQRSASPAAAVATTSCLTPKRSRLLRNMKRNDFPQNATISQALVTLMDPREDEGPG